jgi:hypothetical protein
MAVNVNKRQEPLPLILGLVVAYVSQGRNRDGILCRRLITLIYAGWLPHDLASSWHGLSLRSEVRQKLYSNRLVEGPPERDRGSVSDLGLFVTDSHYV